MPLALASRLVEERNSSRNLAPRARPVGTRPELEGIGVGMAVPFTLIWKLFPLVLVTLLKRRAFSMPHPALVPRSCAFDAVTPRTKSNAAFAVPSKTTK